MSNYLHLENWSSIINLTLKIFFFNYNRPLFLPSKSLIRKKVDSRTWFVRSPGHVMTRSTRFCSRNLLLASTTSKSGRSFLSLNAGLYKPDAIGPCAFWVVLVWSIQWKPMPSCNSLVVSITFQCQANLQFLTCSKHSGSIARKTQALKPSDPIFFQYLR
jgi:hypothetical protein